jgi:HAMP domain-containing protein
MSEEMYVFSLSVIFGTILLIFVMRYVSAAQQARARLANDDAYRQLAAKATAAQAETAAVLTSIDTTLAELKSRVAALEQILKEVG